MNCPSLSTHDALKENCHEKAVNFLIQDCSIPCKTFLRVLQRLRLDKAYVLKMKTISYTKTEDTTNAHAK